MKRVMVAVALCAMVWAAFGPERERPDPFGPHNPVVLTVELVAPPTNQTVLAGSAIHVRVQGSERSERLAGLGFAARRGNVTLDSSKVAFPAVPDSLHTFSFTVPRDLPTNAQIDLYGYAFGVFGEAIRSSVRTVIVIACAPNCP